MPIVEDEKLSDTESILNTERIRQLLSLYKFPLILTAVGVLFLLLGIVYAVRVQNTPTDVIFSSESSASGSIGKAKIQIDVEGAVINPGVYEFKEGERVSDALVAAGGFSADADRDWVSRNLNRAAKLADGGKIYIPSVTEVTSGQAQSSNVKTQNLNNPSNLLGVTTGKININTATQQELENLPDIGPVTAGKIIAGRPYQTIDELKTKKAVGNATFNKIKDLITL